jgi:predicted aconitase with swiveling domain
LNRELILRANRAYGAEIEGEALVSKDSIHFILDVSHETGEIVRFGHELYGEHIAEKILVLPNAKGGIQSPMGLAELKEHRSAPKALLFGRTNPIMVHGAVLLCMTIMDQFDQDPVHAIKSGDWVNVVPEKGLVVVKPKS